MRSDLDIKRDVEDELISDPDVVATDVGVAVKDGVVTVTGFVRSFRQRRTIEEDVKRVAGVTGVVNNIDVRIPIILIGRPEIAGDAVEAIKSDLPFSWERIKVIVADRWLTLEGDVEWQYQRDLAEKAVQGVRGLRGITNNIQYGRKPRPSTSSARFRKHCAETRRSTRVGLRSMPWEAKLSSGARCALGGARRGRAAAWRAPGVAKVDKRIRIEW